MAGQPHSLLDMVFARDTAKYYSAECVGGISAHKIVLLNMMICSNTLRLERHSIVVEALFHADDTNVIDNIEKCLNRFECLCAARRVQNMWLFLKHTVLFFINCFVHDKIKKILSKNLSVTRHTIHIG